MNDSQDWGKAYQEIAQHLAIKLPEIKLLDFWNDQPYFQEREYPLPPLAVFFEFRASEIMTLGQNAQKIPMIIDVILYYENPGDTHLGGETITGGLGFIGKLRDLHSTLHGLSGDHFSDLTRVAIGPKDPVPGARIYFQSYETVIMDYGAATSTDIQDNTGTEVKMNVTSGVPEKQQDTAFQIP